MKVIYLWILIIGLILVCFILGISLVINTNINQSTGDITKGPTEPLERQTVTFEPEIKISWLGYSVHAIPNPTPDSEQPVVLQVESRIQIGLRDDGIVAWRAIKEKTESEGSEGD